MREVIKRINAKYLCLDGCVVLVELFTACSGGQFFLTTLLQCKQGPLESHRILPAQSAQKEDVFSLLRRATIHKPRRSNERRRHENPFIHSFLWFEYRAREEYLLLLYDTMAGKKAKHIISKLDVTSTPRCGCRKNTRRSNTSAAARKMFYAKRLGATCRPTLLLFAVRVLLTV